MSIISISRDTQNNVSIVRMISTDNLATVASANYITNQMANIRNLNSGFWQWYSSDIIACSASDGNAFFIFTDSTFSTLNEYSGMGVTPAQIQDQAFTYAVDSGAANAYVVNLSPAPSSYHDGMYVAFNAANANSGASTIDVNSLGTQSIVDNSNTALSSGAILAGGDYLLVYNSGFGAFVLINSSLSGSGGSIWTAYGSGSAYLNNNPGSSDNNSLNIGNIPVDTANTSCFVMGTAASSNASFPVRSQYSFALINNVQFINFNLPFTGGIESSFIIGANHILNANNTSFSSVFLMGFNNTFNNPVSDAFICGDSNTINNAASPLFIFGSANTINATGGIIFASNGTLNNAGSAVFADSRSSPAADSTTDQFNSTFGNGFNFYSRDTGGTGSPTLALSIDQVGNIKNSLGECDLSKTIATPASGGTVNLATTNRRTLINPAGTLATLTVNMPSTPANGQLQSFSFTHIITALTVSGNGNTILAAPTSAAVGNSFTFIFDLGTTTWYPTN